MSYQLSKAQVIPTNINGFITYLRQHKHCFEINQFAIYFTHATKNLQITTCLFGHPLAKVTIQDRIDECKEYEKGFHCDICGINFDNEYSYHCSECGFDVCPNCIPDNK